MYYEISVSKSGKRLFATDDKITTPLKLNEVFPLISKAFPVAQGFNVTVTKWERIGGILTATLIAGDDI